MGLLPPGNYKTGSMIEGAVFSRIMLDSLKVCPSCGVASSAVRINADGSRRCTACGVFFEKVGDRRFVARSPGSSPVRGDE